MTSQTTIPGVLHLPAAMDLVAAAPLRSELLSRRGGPLELNGAEVERFGGLCLQVLLAAGQAWSQDGQPFRLTSPSPALIEGLRTLGALTALDDCLEESFA